MNPQDPANQDLPRPAAGSPWSRRELLQKAAMVAVLLPQEGQRGFGRRGFRPRTALDPSQIPAYRFRTMRVERFAALQNEFNAARGNAQFGRAKLYVDQIAPLSVSVPRDFPTAKSLVVVAAHSKNMYATFRYKGNAYRVLVPFQYYADDLDAEKLRATVQKEVVGTPGRRVVDISARVPLKLLAARSGLGRYGRNGLIFVDGMGSYCILHAFLTDHAFPEDNWTDLQILGECNHCHACERSCPTGCISRWSFGANIDRCLTLYNENPGEFPNYILGSMHHALMGCMRCKAVCPANEGVAELSGTLEDITEDETRKILNGTPDEALMKSLQRKLRQFRAVATKDQFPVMKRNLGVLIRA